MARLLAGPVDLLLCIYGNVGGVLYKRYKYIGRDKRFGGRAKFNHRHERPRLQRYRVVWQSMAGASVFNILYAALYSNLPRIIQIQLVSVAGLRGRHVLLPVGNDFRRRRYHRPLQQDDPAVFHPADNQFSIQRAAAVSSCAVS